MTMQSLQGQTVVWGTLVIEIVAPNHCCMCLDLCQPLQRRHQNPLHKLIESLNLIQEEVAARLLSQSQQQ